MRKVQEKRPYPAVEKALVACGKGVVILFVLPFFFSFSCSKAKPVGSGDSRSGAMTCARLCQRIIECSPTPVEKEQVAEVKKECQKSCEEAAPSPSPEGELFGGLKKCASSHKECKDLRSCIQKEFQTFAEKMRGPEEDPNAVYKVPVENTPMMGPSDALVTVISFLDARCGFCSRAHKVLDEIVKLYPKELRLSQRQFPLGSEISQKAAEASLEVRKQKGEKAYWDYQQKMFNAKELDENELLKLAKEVGADDALLKKALEGKTHAAQVKADVKLGMRFGISGTPCFFINGRKLSGYLPTPEFKKIVEDALKKARAEVAKGIKPDLLYAHLIEKGSDKVVYLKKGRPAPPPPPEPRKLDKEANTKQPTDEPKSTKESKPEGKVQKGKGSEDNVKGKKVESEGKPAPGRKAARNQK